MLRIRYASFTGHAELKRSFSSLQVQSIANLATGIFAELSQLSPTLVAVSKTLVGVSSITAYTVKLLFVPSHTASQKTTP